MGVHGWMCKDIDGYGWILMAMYGRIFMDMDGY